MNTIGIIPARFASSRFPGKPLVKISGKTMIQRVYEQASKVLPYVVVATDDERIFDSVKSFQGQVVFTSANHQSGTERCAEALNIAEHIFNIGFEQVINIQGDEPFIQPEQINMLLNVLNMENTSIATLAARISDSAQIFDSNVVKVVFSQAHKALYFSREPIPHVRGAERNAWHEKTDFYKHIGIYGYKSDVLRKLPFLTAHPLEWSESLEQNRWIANDFIIRLDITNIESISVDTPEDLAYIQNQIKNGMLNIDE